MRFAWFVLLAACLFGDASAEPADLLATGASGTPSATTPTHTRKRVGLSELGSPRSALFTFLTAMRDARRGDSERVADALAVMDLSELPTVLRKREDADMAWMLFDILERSGNTLPARLSAKKDGLSVTLARFNSGVLRMLRHEDGRWQFDSATIKHLKDIWLELENYARSRSTKSTVDHLPWYLRMRTALPAGLKRSDFLLENWQWLAILLFIAIGQLLDKFVSWLLRIGVRRWKARTAYEYRQVPDDMLRPLGLAVMAFVWWLALQLLGLPETVQAILYLAVEFLLTLSAVWGMFRLVDLITAWLLRMAHQSANRLDDALVPLLPKTLKLFVVIIGLVFIAGSMDIDVTGLLAGLGLGGLAFALAAKDMVQNLFGSITVLADRTFHVGDWIVTEGVEGTVESIGFRSTRIRTFYNSLVTVPNSAFITAQVDNMGKRRYRRMKTTLGLTYDTPTGRIDAFCEGVRELIRNHPYMRKDYYHVYFNAYAPAALEILVYVFWEAPDWGTELRERHRFLLDILRLARALDVEFAYPTQTIHLKQEADASREETDVDREQAYVLGQEVARAIAEEGLGNQKRKPAPVRFPPGR